MQRLTGKVAVVTGSSWGIGGAIALRFAHEGADVVINYARSIAEAHDVRTQVEAAGQRGLVVQADLRSPAEAARLVEEASRHLGGLDILVNNAGGGTPRPFTEVTEADYDGVVDLNLKGVFFASQAFARHLIGADGPAGLSPSARCTRISPSPATRPTARRRAG
jgi:glucose 1-dehydrogenase